MGAEQDGQDCKQLTNNGNFARGLKSETNAKLGHLRCGVRSSGSSSIIYETGAGRTLPGGWIASHQQSVLQCDSNGESDASSLISMIDGSWYENSLFSKTIIAKTTSTLGVGNVDNMSV